MEEQHSHHEDPHVLVLREQEAGCSLADSILEVGHLLNNLEQQQIGPFTQSQHITV